jgi:uncharacterized protein YdeI (YjbR/CyaY-like superfamily)
MAPHVTAVQPVALTDLEQIFPKTILELKTWLKENHGQKESVWLIRWKKQSGQPTLDYDDIVDELICFGWIDSLPRKLDAERSLLRISPRNPNSNWSGLNKQRVERLIKSGKMHTAGETLIAIAKQIGTWDFLDDVERLEIPADLAEEFSKTAKSKKFFDNFPDSSKRGILEWIKSAKKADTRAKRIKSSIKHQKTPKQITLRDEIKALN